MNTNTRLNCRECGSSDTWFLIEVHRIISVNCYCHGSAKAFKVELTDTKGISIQQDTLQHADEIEEYYEWRDDHGCETCFKPYTNDNKLLNSIKPIDKTVIYSFLCCGCKTLNKKIIYEPEIVQELKQMVLFVITNPKYIKLMTINGGNVTWMIDILETYAGLRKILNRLKSVDQSQLPQAELNHHKKLLNECCAIFNKLIETKDQVMN